VRNDPPKRAVRLIPFLSDPPAEMLPTDDDVDDELPLLLQDWLDSDPALLSQIINLNTRTLRRFLLAKPRPTGPLYDIIFFRDHLKLFTYPDKTRGEDNVFYHLASLWGA
jgi:hypothetical protein